MKSEVRKIAYTVGIAILILAAAEVAMHNWRVSLSLEMLESGEMLDSLRREKQELELELAGLTSPQRLQMIGTSLGLEPLPLKSFLLVETVPEHVVTGADSS